MGKRVVLKLIAVLGIIFVTLGSSESKALDYFGEPVLQRLTGPYKNRPGVPNPPPAPDKIDATIRSVTWDGRLAFLTGWGFRTIKSMGEVTDGKFKWKMGRYIYLRGTPGVTFLGPALGADPDYPINPVYDPTTQRRTYYLRMISFFDKKKLLDSNEILNLNSLTADQTGKPCLGNLQIVGGIKVCQRWATDNYLIEIRARVVVDNVTNEIIPDPALGPNGTSIEPVQTRLLTWIDTNGFVRPVEGIEPGITFDSGLVVFKARVPQGPYDPNNLDPQVHYFHAVSYTYRTSMNFDNSTWNKPRSLTDPTTTVRSKYPLFRYPILNPDGTRAAFTFPASEIDSSLMDFSKGIIAGAYPWIAPDGDMLYMTGLPSGDECNMRAGYVVVGAATNHTLRLIDSGPNWSRGMYGKTSCVGATGTDMSALASQIELDYVRLAERTLPDNLWPPADDTKPFDSNFGSYPVPYRQFLVAPIQKGTAWDPFASTRADYRTLPNTRAPRADMLFTGTGSGAYGEISYEDSTDGSYLFYYQMNEMMTPVHLSAAASTASNRTLLLNKTPDTSGHFRNGALSGGAVFSQERNWITNPATRDLPLPTVLDPGTTTTQGPTLSTSQSLAIDNDASEGFEGQSVSFPPTGCVKFDSQNGSLSDLANIVTNGLMFSSWLRVRSVDLHSDLNLVLIPESFSLSIKAAERAIALVDRTSNLAPILGALTPIPFDRWVHISLRLVTSKALVYVDGQQITTIDLSRSPGPYLGQTMLSNTMSNFNGIRIGPCASSSSYTSYAYDLDQVNMSAQSRYPDFVLRQAYRSRSTFLAPSQLEARVSLGEYLFNKRFRGVDGRLVSCSSCHNEAEKFYAPTSGLPSPLNPSRRVSSILFAPFSPELMADGSSTTLEGQVSLPITNPREHNTNFTSVISEVKAEPGNLPFTGKSVGQSFRDAFSTQDFSNPLDLVTETNIKSALADFQRRKANQLTVTLADRSRVLVRDLQTFPEAIFPEGSDARKGFDLFRGKGRCIGCHSGPLLTDHQFHDNGLLITVPPGDTQPDTGRFMKTSMNSDAGKSRTPSLWNVKHKKGFFRNGAAVTLDEVLDHYNRGGAVPYSGDPGYPQRRPEVVPLYLTTQDKLYLKSFLDSLSTD